MTENEEMDSELLDKEIDVKKIMEKIRENVRKRREKQKVVEIEELERKSEVRHPAYSLQEDLDFINANWDMENKTYHIFSHRKVLGNVLIRGRKLVHGEVKRYVDPIFWKQKEFNSSTVRILNNFSKEVPEIKEQINERIDLDYFKFEDKFRGSEEDIKERQKIYVQYFKSKKNVLDVGCGRGEFLELLRENGVDAKGVDANKNLVEYCNKKGLDVNLVDGVDYLKSISDNSLGGIFMAQVIEHLKPRSIVEILKLAYKKLTKDSYFIIETVNPTSFAALSSFNLDPSHVTPLPPSLMEFLLSSVGFKKIEIKFLASFSNKLKLKKIGFGEKPNSEDKKFIKVYNENVEKLNSLLYGYQDYAAICKKA